MENKRFQLKTFKAGSWPEMEGSAQPVEFYIIKEGRMIRSSNHLPAHLTIEEELEPGDFFGVVSCMAQRPHLHTVMALEDSKVIAVKREDFDVFISQHTSIAFKLIRYYSQQLRHCDINFAKLSFQMEPARDSSQLVRNGEYLLKIKKNPRQAAFAFDRFLKFNPDHPHADKARFYLNQIQKRHLPDYKRIEQGIYTIYEDGSPIFMEQVPGDTLYLIQSGEVSITTIYDNRELLLKVLGPGDIFGEMAILDNKPRTANAFAHGPVTLLRVTRENFYNLIEKAPHVATRVIELLSTRIWFLHQHVLTVMIENPVTRIYHALYIHMLKDRIKPERGESYQFELTWDDLIHFCGYQDNSQETELFEYFARHSKFDLSQKQIICNDTQIIVDHLEQIESKVDIMKALGKAS